MMTLSLTLFLTLTGAIAGFHDEQRKNMKQYLETRHLYDKKQAAEDYADGRRLGLNDDFNAALANFGPDLERSVKAALLRTLGATESDGMPRRQNGSMFLPELHKDVKTIVEHLGKLVQADKAKNARRLQEKRISPDDGMTVPSAPVDRYSVGQQDGLTWHNISLAGSVRSLRSDSSKPGYFGECTRDKQIAQWWTTGGQTSSLYEDPKDQYKCVTGASGPSQWEYDNPPGQIVGEWPAHYCKLTGDTVPYTGYALMGATCPSYPGFTKQSHCSVQKNTLPVQIKCELELVMMDEFTIFFEMIFKIGYGGSGRSDDLLAEASFGMWTNELPRPCLGAKDYECMGLKKVWDAMEKVVDIGGAIGGTLMKETFILYPMRFSFPAKYPKFKNQQGNWEVVEPMSLFRIPVLEKSIGSTVGTTTEGISLEGGGLCMSKVFEKLKSNSGNAKTALKLLGFAMPLMGSDLCIETPGVALDDKGSLKMGFKVKGYALDKSKVDVSSIWNLFPTHLKILVDGYDGQQGLKDVFETSIAGYSLQNTLEESLKGLFPEQGQSFEFDVAQMLADSGSEAVVTDGANHVFKFDNFATPARRLTAASHDPSDSEPRDMVTFDFPDSFFAEQRHLYDESRARRLQNARPKVDYTYNIEEGFQSRFIKEGSKCFISITGMPKTLQCDVVLGYSNDSSIDLKLRANTQLMYDLNGKDLIVTAGAGFSFGLQDVPAGIDQALVENVKKLEKILDFGAMIDEVLTGGITLLPLRISLPANFNEDWSNVFEVARVASPTLKEEGLCLRNLAKLGVHPSVDDIIKSIAVFMEPVGGDVCIKTPNLDLSTGFKLDMKAVVEVFNKEKVQVWPMVKNLANVFPPYKWLIDIADTIITNNEHAKLNKAVASFMPEQMDTEYDIGKALYEASSRRLEVTSQHGRRLWVRSFLNSEGIFDLGGYPASAAPGSEPVGVEKTTTSVDAMRPLQVAEVSSSSSLRLMGVILLAMMAMVVHL